MGKMKETGANGVANGTPKGGEPAIDIDNNVFRPRLDGLRGDIRDHILRAFKELPDCWQKMTEEQQEKAIHRASDIAGTIVTESTTLIAGRGFKHHEVVLGKITVDKGMIECKFATPYSGAAIYSLCSRKGDTVMLIPRDAQSFYSERKPAKPDKVGSLGLPVSHDDGVPTSGPGTPTDPAVMDALGKGPDAAEQVTAQ